MLAELTTEYDFSSDITVSLKELLGIELNEMKSFVIIVT